MSISLYISILAVSDYVTLPIGKVKLKPLLSTVKRHSCLLTSVESCLGYFSQEALMANGFSSTYNVQLKAEYVDFSTSCHW